MEGQQFCLRWHNFQNTLLSSLPKLLDGGHLTDVTLSAGGRHIHAHKIILSACSYYFKELFKDLNSLQHPVIVLPDMEYGNLCALVTFMYSGEVNIYQEQLPALLAMANTLHIRGLADIAGKSSKLDDSFCTNQSPLLTQQSQEKSLNEDVTKKEPKEIISSMESTESLSLPEVNQQLEEESYNEQDIQQRNMAYCVKTTPYYSINAKLNQREKVPGLINASSGSNKYLDKRYTTDTAIEEMVASVSDADAGASRPLEGSTVKPSAIWDASFKFLGTSSTSRTSSSSSHVYNKSSVTCLVCGKQLSNQYNLRVHMETHSNSSYSCNACSHVSRSRDALRKHVSYRHPVATPQKRSRYNAPKS